MSFKTRFEQTLLEVASCCEQAQRDPEEVQVVAVSKSVGLAEIEQAIAAGAENFGENRPDQLLVRAATFPAVNWHFIGNVQSRRINHIVACASLVHSLYKPDHLRAFEQAAADSGKVQEVLFEVNVSGEASKSGLRPEEVGQMLDLCENLPHIRVRGLMTMAPRGNAVLARHCFEGLATLKDRLRSTLSPSRAAVFNELSMGMSEDWHEAVFAGATIVRIGRALFDDTFSVHEKEHR